VTESRISDGAGFISPSGSLEAGDKKVAVLGKIRVAAKPLLNLNRMVPAVAHWQPPPN